MNSFSRERSFDPNNSNWMISFGDLLTLLVCFFLAIMSERWRTGVSPSTAPPESPKIIQDNQAIVAMNGTNRPGTSLAHTPSATVISELVLFSREIVSDVSEPNTDGLRRLNAWERENRSKLGVITIEACSRESEQEPSIDGQRLAVGIRRLLGTLGETRVTKLRSAGTDCDGIQSWTPTTSTPLAVVKLVTNEKEHG